MIKAYKYVGRHTYMGNNMIDITLKGNQNDSVKLYNLTEALKVDGFIPHYSDVNLKTGRIEYVYSFRTYDIAKDFLKYYKKLRRILHDKNDRD